MDTNLRFTMLNRDLDGAISRTANDPILARETEYFEQNFGNVKTVDDLLDDYRLYNYVMKAMGMEDMAYAKGMVRDVLVQGTTDENALANTLDDSRFKDLADVFQFNENGTIKGTFDWNDLLLDQQMVRHSKTPGEEIDDDVRLGNYFIKKMQKDVVFSAQLISDPALFRVISVAFEMPPEVITGTGDEIGEWVDENVDMDELMKPNVLQDTVDIFQDKLVEQKDKLIDSVAEMYVEVNFEEAEGEQSEGVRLALMFQRTAKDVTDVYEILASPALFQVVRTVLGLPEDMVNAGIDAQAEMISDKLDVEIFQDPEEVSKFVKKFVILHDAINGIGVAPTVQLFTHDPNMGISADLLATVSSLKFGG
ncbi:hypothetical protein PsAD2_04561 [Pseudovibrio axinellae]|uniref:Flagellar protein n=1 Tax=Pseudovibrio axinellae TaxID=989403 RepID=A0A165SY36_9HYPH|nr:DUF1217 domain-containing protein [Pseudovibrio axinellae]KZL05010.1 hypothetical protein PsAD2_04561 [Pseudovibrio axinellae]SER64675.1 Protein of unknown function [Pseudovibrio axinellae]